MFEPVAGLPRGVIGFVAHGQITAADRGEQLEPCLNFAAAAGRVSLLYTLASDFTGYDHGGLYDAAVFGTHHFTDFARIAFLSGDGPYRRAVIAMTGLMPAVLRVFPVTDLDDAVAWLAEGDCSRLAA